MKFRSDKQEQLFRLLARSMFEGDDREFDSIPTSELVEVYLKGKWDYQRRITNMKRSQSAKYGWRRHRFSYDMGLKRYHRNASGKISSLKYLTNKLKNLKKRLAGKEKKEESKILEALHPYEVFGFLTALNIAKVGVLKESQFFELEESQAEYSIFVEKVCDAFSEIEACLVCSNASGVSESAVEMLFLVCSENLFTEDEIKSVDAERSLYEFFMAREETEIIDETEGEENDVEQEDGEEVS